MLVKQISVFLENKSGRLADVTKALGDNGINIGALSLADTKDFGILRLIVNEPDKAEHVLRDLGFAVRIANVLAISVPDRPGGLAEVLGILGAESVDIEYLYAFVGKRSENAIVIMRIEQPEKALDLMQKAGITVLPSKTVYEI
jgi:hypothetical protein